MCIYIYIERERERFVHDPRGSDMFALIKLVLTLSAEDRSIGVNTCNSFYTNNNKNNIIIITNDLIIIILVIIIITILMITKTML